MPPSTASHGQDAAWQLMRAPTAAVHSQSLAATLCAGQGQGVSSAALWPGGVTAAQAIGPSKGMTKTAICQEMQLQRSGVHLASGTGRWQACHPRDDSGDDCCCS
jgi:hypothetical protein